MTADNLTVNDTDYRWPDLPVVVVCTSRPVSDEYARRAGDARLHSYQAFDYAFNGVVG